MRLKPQTCTFLPVLCNKWLKCRIIKLFGGLLLLVSYNENRQLIKHVKRDKDEHECEGVAAWGDDGCGDKEHYDGVSLVLSQEAFLEDAQDAEQPCQEWHFENNAHDEDEHREVIDVAL